VVSVGHVERATIPVHLHLQPGTYRAHAERADGASADSTLQVSAGQIETVRFEMHAVAPAPKPMPARPILAPTPVSQRADHPSTSSSTQQLWGWIALGGGVALSGAAVILGLNALSARDDFENSGRTDGDAHDRAASLRLWTNIAWGGAALTGGTGLYLLLTTPKIEM
jgi:hypothetical protein